MIMGKRIGERIRRAREEKKLTQLDLAFKLNCTQVNVSRMELGLSIPSVMSLYLIADILEVSIHSLLPDEYESVA